MPSRGTRPPAIPCSRTIAIGFRTLGRRMPDAASSPNGNSCSAIHLGSRRGSAALSGKVLLLRSFPLNLSRCDRTSSCEIPQDKPLSGGKTEPISDAILSKARRSAAAGSHLACPADLDDHLLVLETGPGRIPGSNFGRVPLRTLTEPCRSPGRPGRLGPSPALAATSNGARPSSTRTRSPLSRSG
jgi:hypothetical protein